MQNNAPCRPPTEEASKQFTKYKQQDTSVQTLEGTFGPVIAPSSTTTMCGGGAAAEQQARAPAAAGARSRQQASGTIKDTIRICFDGGSSQREVL